ISRKNECGMSDAVCGDEQEAFLDLALSFPESSAGSGAAIGGGGGGKGGNSDGGGGERMSDVGEVEGGGGGEGGEKRMVGKESRGRRGSGLFGGGVLALRDLLAHFLAPEELSGKNQYFCEHCASLQDAEKVLL